MMNRLRPIILLVCLGLSSGPAWFEPTARRAMEFFSEQVGLYSYEKLANVKAAGFSGGTEHASAIN